MEQSYVYAFGLKGHVTSHISRSSCCRTSRRLIRLTAPLKLKESLWISGPFRARSEVEFANVTFDMA